MNSGKEREVHQLRLYREMTVMQSQGWGMRFFTEDDISGEYVLVSTGKTYHLHHMNRGIDLNLSRERALQAIKGERLQIFKGEW